MFTFLYRTWRRLGHLPWLLPLCLSLGIFATSWALMWLVEGGSELVRPGTYWWYFLITSTTVGYGDQFPVSVLGRLVGAYVAIGGIITLTLVFARVSAALESARSTRMQGLAEHDLADHVVVVGYATGRTERVVRGLLTDDERPVVVCAWDDQADHHPMATEERVHFVRGDLTDPRVLSRAAVARAHSVLVDARDDNEAVTVLLALQEVVRGAHQVVTLRDPDRRHTVRRAAPEAHTVQWHSVGTVVEELVDPGLALVYQDLMSAEGRGTYSSPVPDAVGERAFGDWQQALGRRHGATVLAVGDGRRVTVSPAWDTPVAPGTVLYYVADERLDAAGLRRCLE